uniref:Uncharacterized protein n=1 Tax=Gossypium raimondii TaxID=29730 RepID=A0A0D2QZ26_GOSRA|nr:hypothetical protein B456_007G254600 [Gossypium raimondii]
MRDLLHINIAYPFRRLGFECLFNASRNSFFLFQTKISSHVHSSFRRKSSWVFHKMHKKTLCFWILGVADLRVVENMEKSMSKVELSKEMCTSPTV